MADFTAWKNSVLGKVLDVDGVPQDKGQCSQVPVSWAMACFPGIKWSELLQPLGSDAGVAEWAGKSTKYFTWVENNHADIHQLPPQGAIAVFGPTPAKGFINQFKNAFGHAGVIDSASSSGYTLVQEDAPNKGQAVNDSSYPWNLNPCLGWFLPANHSAPVPVPPKPVMSSMVGKTINFAVTNKFVPVWNVGGPYDYAHHTHGLDPNMFKRTLSYEILQDLGNGLYVINTIDWGHVVVSINGVAATITG